MQPVVNLWNLLSNAGYSEALSLEQVKRLHLTNRATVFTAGMTLVYLWLFVAVELPTPALVMAIAIAGYTLVLLLNHRRHYSAARMILLLNGNLQIFSVAFLLGKESGIHLFLVVAAFSPFLYFSAEKLSRCVLYAGFSVLLYVLLEVADLSGLSQSVLSDGINRFLYATTYVALVLSMIVFASYVTLETHRVEMLLNDERDRSDNLLLNILPKPISERLKDGEKPIADYHEQVSILFSDIVGFTPLSEKLAPQQTVDLLDEVFSYFDRLVAHYGVEKVRTVGDGYYVAAGVPVKEPRHAQTLAALALDMQDFRRHVRSPLAEQLQIRIGIDTGPVVAGVVGTHKFQFDMWGDAVNTASRMESMGIPGKVQITDHTYQLLKDEFLCESRGVIDVKGKGAMETWFVLGRRGAGEARTVPANPPQAVSP